MNAFVVKIGSSTLVDPAGDIRGDVIEARVRELVRLRRQGFRPVLVSSGAVASGMGRLGMDARPAALPDLQALAAVGQGVLFQRYVEAFSPHGFYGSEDKAVALITSFIVRHSQKQ